MKPVKRFFCGLSRHVDAAGRSLSRVRLDPIPTDYRERYKNAPAHVSIVECANCGKILDGTPAEKLVRLRESPWP